MHTNLLGITATAALVVCLLLGGEVSLYDFRVSITTRAAGLVIGLTPTFLCWMDTRNLFYGACYGNLMVCSTALPTEVHKARIVAHEARHLEHFEAFGLWASFMQYLLPLEPSFVDWADPAVELRQMWRRPIGWPYRWSLLEFEMEAGR